MPISLGQITFGIGPDTTRLRASIADITNFGQAVEAAARATGQGANAATAALLRQEQAAISALQKVQRFQDQVARASAPANLTQGFNQLSTRALDQFTQRMTMGRLSAIQYQREMERFGQTMSNAGRIFKDWSAATGATATERMVESLKKLSGAATLVYGPLSGVATRISVIASLADHFNLAWAAVIAGVAGGVYAFVKMSGAIIQVEKDIEKVTLSLTAVTGSVTIANLQLKSIAELSDRAGVSFVDLAKEFGQLEAASKGTSLEGEKTVKIFEAVTLAGAKLGLGSEQVKGTLIAIEQMMSKGTIAAQELHQQLGNQLPGALQIMAEATGVSTQKLNQMMQKGELSISILSKFADVLKKRYSIDDATKVETISAAENRLANARVRMLDSLNKVLGVSDAYKNTLNFITEGINGQSTAASKLISIISAVGASFLGYFASSAVIGGITAIAAGIRAITASVAALNVALLVSGAGELLAILARLGIAVGAGIAGYKITQAALADTGQSFLNATPPVQEYINAQKQLTTSVRKPTLDYLEQQKQKLVELQAQQESMVRSGANLQDALTVTPGTPGIGLSPGRPTRVTRNPDLQHYQDLNSQVVQTKKNIVDLEDILKRQTEAENNRKDPVKELTSRQELAVKRAKDQTKELKETYDALYLAPAAKDYAELQVAIYKGTETFRDTLERAEVPLGTVNKLTAEYSKNLRLVKEGELNLKTQTSYFQVLADVFGKGLDSALTGMINTIFEGKNAFEELRNTAKAVAEDIFKTMIQLAALNPLKNALFGTNAPVLGGNAGIGGMLGSLFGGSQQTAASTQMVGSYAMPVFAKGGIMPFKRYAGGGIASSPQLAMYGDGNGAEAFVPLPDGRSIPVAMQGGMGAPEIHIHESPGAKAQVSTSKNSNGQPRLDIHLKDMVKSIFMDDIQQNGDISKTMSRQYGLNRGAGIGR